MTKQNCTSGLRTTKEKSIPFTRTLWVWGSCVFYYKKQTPTPLLTHPLPPHRLPLQVVTLGGFHHG